jgi:hypothetical protein
MQFTSTHKVALTTKAGTSFKEKAVKFWADLLGIAMDDLCGKFKLQVRHYLANLKRGHGLKDISADQISFAILDK